jgi:hypothetical protein
MEAEQKIDEQISGEQLSNALSDPGFGDDPDKDNSN